MVIRQQTALVNVTSKKSPNVYKSGTKMILHKKLPKNNFSIKINKKCGRFGQNNCCLRLRKIAQRAINRPIRSH